MKNNYTYVQQVNYWGHDWAVLIPPTCEIQTPDSMLETCFTSAWKFMVQNLDQLYVQLLSIHKTTFVI